MKLAINLFLMFCLLPKQKPLKSDCYTICQIGYKTGGFLNFNTCTWVCFVNDSVGLYEYGAQILHFKYTQRNDSLIINNQNLKAMKDYYYGKFYVENLGDKVILRGESGSDIYLRPNNYY